MEHEINEFEEIDLKDLIHIIKMRWWIIVLFFVLSVIVTGVVSFKVLDPVYKAEASLFVGKESNSIASIDIGEFSLNQKLVSDYREIILSKLVAKEVIKDLNLDMSVETFQKRVSVYTVKDSRFFKIGFESTNPQIAMDVVNKLSEVIIEKAEEIIQVKNVQRIDIAELPVNPIRPNRTMNIAIAGVLGIMIGVFIIFILEYLNYTIKTDKDVERYLGLNIIGEIPVFQGAERGKKKKKSKKMKNGFSLSLISYLDPKAPASEAYRSLRTNIGYMSLDKQIKTILVTSPGPAEGKTTTSANIAISMTQVGKKVLLVETDLRKPKIHRYFGKLNDVGVTDVIVNDLDIDDVIKPIEKIENLSIISSGAIPPNPAELLDSKKMSIFIDQLKERFDLIIFDTPPVGQLTDAAVLGKLVDGAILVVASGQSNIDIAKHAKASLDNVNVKLLGTVMTKINKASSGAYYNRYYSYDQYYYNN